MVMIIKTEAEKLQENKRIADLELTVSKLVNLVNEMNNGYGNLINDLNKRLKKLENGKTKELPLLRKR